MGPRVEKEPIGLFVIGQRGWDPLPLVNKKNKGGGS